MQETQARIAGLTKKDDGDGILQHGAKVRIEGLMHSPELNGLVGTVRTFDYGTERYVVELPGRQPRRLRMVNLEPLSENGHPLDGDDGSHSGQHAPASICQQAYDPNQKSAQGQGPLGFAPGTNVTLRNLTSAAAIKQHLNGQEGVVHCFDEKSQRYVVALADGKPRKIKPQNLGPAQPAPICQAELAGGPVDNGPRNLAPGTNVTLQNLTSAAAQKAHLNGMAAVVHCFDKTSGRYVVALSNGTPRKIRPENLALKKNGSSQAALVTASRQQSVIVAAPPEPHLSLCNAYASHAPMQVFAVKGGGGKKRYMQVARNLAYQDCADVKNFPYADGSLSFVIGRYTVGRYLNVSAARLGTTHGLELTVYRNSVNSLKASVHENLVQLSDLKAYHLNVVDAYAGAKKLELHVQRGTFVQKLPLNSTFRLSREEQLVFTLTDGKQRLHMSLQPRRSRTYTVMLTGADMGLRGEPRNVGLVAHEVGAWTSSEEMPQLPNNEGLLLEAGAHVSAGTNSSAGDDSASDGSDESDRSSAHCIREFRSIGFVAAVYYMAAAWLWH